MPQYIYTMNRVSKIVPPKRNILRDISLSFYPGAKIGVLGLNGSGKSSLLRIMAGVDTDIEGEARPQAGTRIGYLPQEPVLNDETDVRANVEEALADVKDAMAELDQVYAAYAEPDADFDALAKRQGELENIIQAADGHNLERQLAVAATALRLPPWDAAVKTLSGGERRRVALCRLLLAKPDMLLLDEPTEGLQPSMIQIIRDAVVAMRDQGVAVILVEQRLDAVLSLADRVTFLENGHSRETVDADVLRHDTTLIDKYVGV